MDDELKRLNDWANSPTGKLHLEEFVLHAAEVAQQLPRNCAHKLNSVGRDRRRIPGQSWPIWLADAGCNRYAHG